MVILFMSFTGVAFGAPERIDFFGFSTKPPTNSVSSVCFIDVCGQALRALGEKVSRSGGQSIEEKAAFAKAHFSEVKRACDCLSTGFILGVTKLPALVFEEKSVIYGTNDTFLARRHFTDFERGAS